MKLISRLKEIVKPNHEAKSPYGDGWLKNCSAALLLEAWEFLPDKDKEVYVRWAKLHEYDDYIAWKILAKAKGSK